MLNRKLGNTGIAVSKIALGTMYFGSETPEDDAFAILDTFVEAGGNLIDTADVYVGGVSEQIIGRWFAARPREVTDRVVLASKGRFGGSPGCQCGWIVAAPPPSCAERISRPPGR